MKKWRKKVKKNQKIPKSQKVAGNLVIYAVALGAMIFTIGSGLLRVQGAEMRFVADLYNAEKAHFAAESGIEMALWHNSREKRNHIADFSLDFTENEAQIAEFSIKNRVSAFEFTLKPEESRNIAFESDQNDDESTNFDRFYAISGTVLAENGALGNKYRVNKCLGSENSENEVLLASNSLQNVTINVQNASESGKTCEIRITNENSSANGENGALMFTFSAENGLSPVKTRVNSLGKAGSREKQLTFVTEIDNSLLNLNYFQQ